MVAKGTPKEEGVNVLDLFGGEATTNLDWNGQRLTIKFNPNEYTPEVEAGWQEMEQNGWMSPVLVDFVARLVTWWDLKGFWDTEKEKLMVGDEMFPIVEGQLRHLPTPFLAAVVNKITEEAAAGR